MSQKSFNEKLQMVIVWLPSLTALLLQAERQKGMALTRQEVEQVRDNATCVTVPDEIARNLDLSRGYGYIDPQRCWEQWSVSGAVSLT